MRLALCTLYFVVCTFIVTLGGSSTALAQDTDNHAGLVLQFPDGTTQTYCIPLEGDSISGFDLLMKTGLPVKVEAYGGLGVEVCQIGDTGCNYPDQPCACRSYGPGGVYWSYHHLKNGKWVASVLGAGSYRVHDGDVEGWAWSDGKPPALYTFAQLCAASQPINTATPQPQPPTEQPATPIPPTATRRPSAPSPTRKPQPTATARPIAPPPLPSPIPTTPTLPPLPPTEPPLPSPTVAFILTNTAATPPSITPTPTPQPTNTAASPTPTPTPIRNAQAAPESAIRNQEDVARSVGLAIGGLVLGSLAIWGIATAIRRARNGDDTNVE